MFDFKPRSGLYISFKLTAFGYTNLFLKIMQLILVFRRTVRSKIYRKLEIFKKPPSMMNTKKIKQYECKAYVLLKTYQSHNLKVFRLF